MKTRRLTCHPLSILLIACAVFPLLLSACQPSNVSASLPTLQPTENVLPAVEPTETMLPEQPSTATQPPDQATQPPSGASGDITLDLSGVAQGQLVEMVAAVPAGDGPWWEAAPQYRHVILDGYPITSHMWKPQIFIYPAGELASANENMGKAAANLQALLQTQQAGDELPFLPLINSKQVIQSQVQYLDFKNGKGVRYLTWYSQGMMLVNNFELIYTFQGLTSDGKYYIAAVLPVTHSDLPATPEGSKQVGAEYRDYLTKTVAWLNQQPSGSFTPDLAKLDALIQSIEVK